MFNILRINLLAAKFSESRKHQRDVLQLNSWKTSGEIYKTVVAVSAMTDKQTKSSTKKPPKTKTLRN